jgi:hypothetical protein
METLRDAQKRKIYDRDPYPLGSNSERLSLEQATQVYVRVTKEKLDDEQGKYRFSKQEENDIVKAYRDYNGDMNQIIARVPFSNDDDRPRFHTLLKSIFTKKLVVTNLEGKEADLEEEDVAGEDQSGDDKEDGEDGEPDDEDYEPDKTRIQEPPSKRAKTELMSLRDKEANRISTLVSSLTSRYGKGKYQPEPSEDEFLLAYVVQNNVNNHLLIVNG